MRRELPWEDVVSMFDEVRLEPDYGNKSGDIDVMVECLNRLFKEKEMPYLASNICCELVLHGAIRKDKRRGNRMTGMIFTCDCGSDVEIETSDDTIVLTYSQALELYNQLGSIAANIMQKIVKGKNNGTV